MLLVSFCSWWYGNGWLRLINSIPNRIQGVAVAFSVSQLLRTLFAPWRRIMTYPGASLQDKVRAWMDTTFSRVVGFVVRIFVLLGALVSTVAILLLTIIEIVVWPLLPFAVPSLLIAGFVL